MDVVKGKHDSYELLNNMMVSLMNVDASLNYPYLEMELHMSARDISAVKNGHNVCIYQYVRVINCIMNEIHLVILMEVLQKELKIALTTHSDLVIGVVPHKNNGNCQPEEWMVVMCWDGVKV